MIQIQILWIIQFFHLHPPPTVMFKVDSVQFSRVWDLVIILSLWRGTRACIFLKPKVWTFWRDSRFPCLGFSWSFLGEGQWQHNGSWLSSGCDYQDMILIKKENKVLPFKCTGMLLHSEITQSDSLLTQLPIEKWFSWAAHFKIIFLR